ncbi:trehalose-phosphatase [Blastococcus sp. PRF04-17]|uniref:trehalose-phosphatase n=1 Tax=Blastococcus sp. PRF04-17 TaxID=2933797 RepID=UPI001FF3F82F|nr:trehalose-phosphatase [Blastococcus sp. PRF04-17]UOY00622.1 trehalose-phosphatase [Blastococcus sp. PRF04-17]
MSALPADLDAALTGFASARPLLVASDYDGVLSPLVGDPSAAVLLPGMADVLTRLVRCDGVTVALVSGRGVADLQRTSGLIGPYRWVGSHGAEFDGPLTDDLAVRRDSLADLLHPLVAGTPGALLEVKPASVAVHVRQVADRAAAAAILERARMLVDSSLTLKPGKEVLEIAVTDADKGTALQRLIAELRPARTMYLGDDVTDEDGFRVLGRDDVPVKIGEGTTSARYRVPDPPAVLTLLERLAELLT